ncbi:hypothetical protein G6F42_024544 [Rhizopus arrhizus]|nr:hypothetical protein G6F42_024544 [Rhizopus arrhizus]
MALVTPFVAPVGFYSCCQAISALNTCSAHLLPRLSILSHLSLLVSTLSCMSPVSHNVHRCAALQVPSSCRCHPPPVWCMPCFHKYLLASPLLQSDRTLPTISLPLLSYFSASPRASQALIVRTNTHGPSHPTSRRPAIRLLQTQQVLLTNFMHFNMLPLVPRPTAQHIDISPITNYSDSISHVSTLLLSLLASSFSFESHAFILSSPTTQGYKSLSIKTDPSFPSSSLGAAKWKQFWSLQILPLNARNTWRSLLSFFLSSLPNFVIILLSIP